MDYRRCIVTITDSVGPTSMPYNEFLRYRLRHYPDEKQVLILLFKTSLPYDIQIPVEVDFYIIGKSLIRLKRTVKKIKNDYDNVLFHIHEGKSVLLFSFATFLKYRNKVVYTLHSTYRNYPFHNKLFSFCASILAGDIVCVSKTSFKYYPKILKWLRGSHALFIQNGVDTERIESVKIADKKENDTFTLIYVARLVSLKRHRILMDALKQLPNVKLQLVGIGPLEDDLKKLAVEFGIEKQVEFWGLQSREVVYEMLKLADLYVSTSSYEGLPVAVLEALGCGTPCLVSNIEQHVEIAEKCLSLQLCSDDIGKWVKKIQHLQTLSHEDLDNLGENNRKSVVKFFSLKSMHEQYNVLYTK